MLNLDTRREIAQKACITAARNALKYVYTGFTADA